MENPDIDVGIDEWRLRIFRFRRRSDPSEMFGLLINPNPDPNPNPNPSRNPNRSLP